MRRKDEGERKYRGKIRRKNKERWIKERIEGEGGEGRFKNEQ